MKTLRQAINKERAKLVARAKKSGLYENFGENEARKLENKYINGSDYSKEMNARRALIRSFDDWCMNYEG